jgi:hypothetical protein
MTWKAWWRALGLGGGAARGGDEPRHAVAAAQGRSWQTLLATSKQAVELKNRGPEVWRMT